MSKLANFRFATHQGATGEPMLTLVFAEAPYPVFLNSNWSRAGSTLRISDEDASATIEVTPEDFSLSLHPYDGQTEQIGSGHNDVAWAQACLKGRRVVVFVGPPELDVDNLNDHALVAAAERGNLIGGYVPLDP
jgi:hypothetical protein